MARMFLVALQAVILALAGLAVGAHAVPFTPQGFVGTPSRLQAGIFLFSTMPFHGLSFLPLLEVLVWVPVITAVVALFQSAPGLRPLRWLGVVVNLSALGYLARAFPEMLSAGKLPVTLFGTAALFAVNAVLAFFLPRQCSKKGPRSLSAFLLASLFCASVAILVPQAARQTLPPAGWAVFAGCLAGMAGAFYCLIRAAKGFGSKKSTGSGLVLVVPVAVLSVLVLFSPPLALPVGAGLLILAAGTVP